MKKIAVVIMAVVMLVCFAACGNKELTPMEKLDAYFTENGVQQGETTVVECPEVIEKIKASDFTIANMSNLKGEMTTEYKLIKTEAGIAVELVDFCITDNGVKMGRSVIINPDGTFEYVNSLIMNGSDMGLKFMGEIPLGTYTKENTPVITDSKLAMGATPNDASKEAMKDYIDLTLDCYAAVLSQEGIGITLADVGYTAYIAG